jgi:hypothetical protein
MQFLMNFSMSTPFTTVFDNNNCIFVITFQPYKREQNETSKDAQQESSSTKVNGFFFLLKLFFKTV